MGLYDLDWRPTPGWSAGVTAGCVPAFATGAAVQYWILAVALPAFGAVATGPQRKARLRRAEWRRQQGRWEWRQSAAVALCGYPVRTSGVGAAGKERSR
jgi:hypothetical protein